ncbi:FixH family protein [Ancylobacter sp. WKF20]|uniref:FixH family protein n=1 Tax=Ancylobacter sp. WKF20 TaxID=3039801 RepID=UPI0024345A90|nr:FixH family protein [Ancylobacter sp. WKF20]WGD29957.1 FixH family protein [Ancylobacter sp. WKF20]
MAYDVTDAAGPAGRPITGRQITGRTVLAIFLGFFGIVFAANFFLVRAAVTSFGGVETESSYKAGLDFRRDSEAAAAQAQLRWQVDAHVEPSRVVVSARDAMGLPLDGVDLAVELHHPTNRKLDMVLTPSELAAGQWSAPSDIPAGQWELVIDFTRGGERVYRSMNRIIVR